MRSSVTLVSGSLLAIALLRRYIQKRNLRRSAATSSTNTTTSANASSTEQQQQQQQQQQKQQQGRPIQLPGIEGAVHVHQDGEHGIRAFQPPTGMAHPGLQCVFATLLKSWRRARHEDMHAFERVYDTPDGFFLNTVFYNNDLPAASPVALLVHGLGGSSQGCYITEMAAQLRRVGVRALAVNSRGVDPNDVLKTGRLYHAGEIRDLVFLLNSIAHEYPQAPLAVVGFSLGGCRALNLMARCDLTAADTFVYTDNDELQPVQVPRNLRACVAVSAPLNLEEGIKALERPSSRMWHKYLLDGVLAWLGSSSHMIHHTDTVDLARARQARSIREFDDTLVAPLHGFRSAAHYYESCSVSRCLSAIRRPTLIIRAADDPFLWAGDCALPELQTNACITSVQTEHGGHVGFVGKGMTCWAETVAAGWLRDRLYVG